MAKRSVLSVRVEEPSEGDVGGGDLDEKKKHAKDDRPIHKGQCAHKDDECYDMVSNHLLIECRVGSDKHNNVECIGHEISASVDKSPDVQVAWRGHAMLIIKDCLTVATYFECCQRAEHYADY